MTVSSVNTQKANIKSDIRSSTITAALPIWYTSKIDELTSRIDDTFLKVANGGDFKDFCYPFIVNNLGDANVKMKKIKELLNAKHSDIFSKINELRIIARLLHETALKLQAAKDGLNQFYTGRFIYSGKKSEIDADKNKLDRYNQLNDLLENLTRGHENLPGADYLSNKLKIQLGC